MKLGLQRGIEMRKQRIEEPINKQESCIRKLPKERQNQAQWRDPAYALMVVQVEGNQPKPRQNGTVGSKHMSCHISSSTRVDLHSASSPMKKGLIEGKKQRGEDTHS